MRPSPDPVSLVLLCSPGVGDKEKLGCPPSWLHWVQDRVHSAERPRTADSCRDGERQPVPVYGAGASPGRDFGAGNRLALAPKRRSGPAGDVGAAGARAGLSRAAQCTPWLWLQPPWLLLVFVAKCEQFPKLLLFFLLLPSPPASAVRAICVAPTYYIL